MIPYIRKIVVENHIPRWFEVYNYFTFLPVFVYPFALLYALFAVTARNSGALIQIVAFVCVLYPLYLGIIFRYNFPLFNRVRFLAIVMPVLVIAIFTLGVVWLFS